ncbi:Anthranilate phosphoribosyltransferase OS=Streptomyces fumanus OX=67302 GN=trpD1 PE=3 SV=1 [Streptomyces fumanus]
MSAVTPAGGDTAAGRSWPAVLNGLLDGREDLSADEAAWAMDRIMRGEATDAQIAGFAVALRAKGETVEEITGLVRTMYERANVIQVPGDTVDIVGTGGDGAKTVNISTMSAIVVAGAGAKVVKHGSRAASSASGASDVLEQLGVNLELSPRRVLGSDPETQGECGAPRPRPARRPSTPSGSASARAPPTSTWSGS